MFVFLWILKWDVSSWWPKMEPNVGLEPTTVGLKVQRSTDGANQATDPYNRKL